MLHFTASGRDEPPPSPARAAIVSIVIGEKHRKCWIRLCGASWRAYAERTGVDIIILTDFIDKSDMARSPAWQKLLVLDFAWAKRYERIIWLDSDIIITAHAPDILRYAGPAEQIGICVDGARLSPSEGQIYVESVCNVTLPPDTGDKAWRHAQQENYAANSLPRHDIQYNTGVMVLSPRHHNEILLRAYACSQVAHLYEQPHLSHLLLEAKLGYHLPPRFNWGIVESLRLYVHNGLKTDDDPEFIGKAVHLLICAEMRNAYFLHFYAAMNLLESYADKAAAESAAQAAAA